MKPLDISLDEARAWWERAGQIHDGAPLVVTEIARPWGIGLKVESGGTQCGYRGRCRAVAGGRTAHRGAGKCAAHGGNGLRGMTEGFMIMAHAFAFSRARALEITPPEALLEEVNRTVHSVRWLDEKLATTISDDQLVTRSMGEWEKDGELAPFVRMWQMERSHLVRVSMAAVTSRAMEMVEQREEMHGAVLHGLVSGVVGEIVREIQEGRIQLGVGAQLRAQELLDGRILALEGVAQETDSPVDSQ